MECPSCGAAVVDGARFCTACGQRSSDATTVFTSPPVAPVEPVGGEPGDGSCPTCGARVGDGRVLCGRCGSVVASGRPGLQPPPQVHRPGRSDRVVGSPDLVEQVPLLPRLLRVLGVLLAALAVGGAAAWATSRPADEVVVSPPTFDPAAHPGDPVGLPVAGVAARGTLEGADGPPSAVLDGEAGTAWVAVEPGSADPPALTLSLDGPAWLVRVMVVNDGADGAAAVQRLLLRTPDGAQVRLELLDLPGTQEVDLPEPLLVARVELVVEQGAGPGPVALAEVALVGHPVRGDAAAGDGTPQVGSSDSAG